MALIRVSLTLMALLASSLLILGVVFAALVVLPAYFFLEPPALVRLGTSMLELTLALGVLIFTLQVAVFLVTPLSVDLSRLAGDLKLRRLPDGDVLSRCAERIARRWGMRPPALYLLDSPNGNAFALAGPLRSAIVLTEGLVNALPARELEFVIAHELSHIRRRDALSLGFWLASARSRVGLARLQFEAVLLPVRITAALPLMQSLIGLILLPIRGVFYICVLLDRAIWRVLRLLDLLINRRMEYRADREGAQIAGEEAAVQTLMRLSGGIEPSFGGVISTHPTTRARIRNIERAGGA
ncbi:M48 family metallopeptidase [Thioalkalivibrio thiocyanodenitrificans]|uniref:M48 family metallopeptidase n=1 Tax=Thioalkalivibrio thiocyanodenitrificans TaxID=243063 RepID=UPI00036E305A|nr:M48 family metallopeptidase [Thioalkalivibrio thiocyanodenitrificans]